MDGNSKSIFPLANGMARVITRAGLADETGGGDRLGTGTANACNCELASVKSVSYTHLTLPTIYSV